MIEIEIKGLTKIAQKFNNAPIKLKKAFQLALQRSGLEAVKNVKMRITQGTDMWKAPIKTGAMRRGIQVDEVRPLEIFIRPSASTPYAKFVHEGTSRMKKRPFFDITKRHDESRIRQFFIDEIGKVFKEILK